MSDIHRRLDNQIKKTNQRENVSSIDDRNQENLNKSEYLGEDLNEEDRTEEDRTERVNCNPFDQENISKLSSIITQGEISQKDKDDRLFCKFEKNSNNFIINSSQNKFTEEGNMQATQIEEIAVGEINYGKDDGTTRTKEVIKEAVPITTRKLSTNVNGDEVIRKPSKNDTIKSDTRKLKTVTLDRVGRMFKSRGQTCEMDKAEVNLDNAVSITESEEKYDEQPSRKDKTNSLGRMLKLVDKDGAPKKLFSHPRAGSLSRIFRKHSTNVNIENIDKTEEESPGIFSRMFNHLRGRSANSRNRSNSNNLRETMEKEKSSLPPKLPTSSKILSQKSSKPPLSSVSSSSSATEKQQPTRSSQRTSNLAYKP
ncbi:hypothetical protein HZH68_005253 [Vespula germanica]|uniref:Uncharacterized protein n=1 Tax=Vespula germanica TaxID=30212 RepID=A0A834KJC5_VESGE|nr:hypothetical protein HZH68_005253 [Vespula germanica]